MICDIAIPIWNKKELTERCVNSILSNTIFPYRILLIDNASYEPTRKYLEGLALRDPDRIKLIVNKENLGYTAAGNQGMKFSDAEYVCILNNDTIVCKGWLSEMVKAAELSGDIGIVNPSSNTFGLNKKKTTSLEEFAAVLNKENSGKYVELGAAVGFCYLVKRKVIEEIGYWDERFSPGYFEDTEYAMRAKKNGYKSIMALGAYVYHEEHSSFKSKEKERKFETLFNESRNKFYALYGKPKRFLYVITKRDGAYFNSLKEKVYRTADKGDWVNILIKEAAGDMDIQKHGNIRKIISKNIFFNWKVLFYILKKKKRFDVIFIGDRGLSRPLSFLKKIHRAEIKWLED